jgi:hypothetical protein
VSRPNGSLTLAAAAAPILLAVAYGLAASPLLAAGAVVGMAVVGGTVAWPLIAVAVMLAMGPVDISFLSGGQRELLPALGGLDMSGIRLVGLSAGLGLVVLTRRDLLQTLTTPAARWYVLFLLWAGATLAFSPAPLEGVRLLLKLAYPLLVFLIVAAPERTAADMRRVGDWAIWGAVLILLINPFVVANGGYAVEAGTFLRVEGPGSHYNPFSFYLLAILLICIARFRTRGHARYLLLGTVAVVWLALTLTRITFLAAAVALAVVGLYTAIADRNLRALLAIGAFGFVTGSIALNGVLERTFGYLPTAGQLLGLMSDPIGLYQAINWQGREVLWGILGIVFMQSPLIGSGLGASSTVLQASFAGQVAHNEYIRLAVDVGLLGCLLYFLAVVAWIRTVLQGARRMRTQGGADEFHLPAIGLIAAWAVIALTDNAFDYYAPFTQYVAFVVAGAAVVARKVTPTEGAQPEPPALAGSAVTGSAALAFSAGPGDAG